MEDREIVALYWSRSETAIDETRLKYEPYLMKIAKNILKDLEDCRECVSDTYLRAWNSMPPHRPGLLPAFLGKITRELSIDRLRYRTRKKRLDSGYMLALSELKECVSGTDTTEQQTSMLLLAESISSYLRSLSPEARSLFVGRYFYLDSVQEAAAYCGMSISKAKSLLHRTRKGLKVHLEKEGFHL